MPKGIPNKPRVPVDTQTAARSSRADAVRQERRKKPGQVAHSGIKLSLDESKLDRKTYHYRFVNDVGGRVQRLTAEDYDVVSEPIKEDASGVGSVVQTHGGVAEAGAQHAAGALPKSTGRSREPAESSLANGMRA